MRTSRDCEDEIPTWVRDWLSRPRLDSYIAAVGPRDALEFYAWNCRASTALFELIGWFEVAWRNNIDRAVCAARPDDAVHWLLDATFPLQPRTWEKVRAATELVTRRERNGSPAPGQVIAELTLGFWRFTAQGYWTTIWRMHLSGAFPHAPGPPDPRKMDRQLDRIIKLRNRIAHHEPIGRVEQVRQVVEDIFAIGRWINPEMAAWWSRRTAVWRVLDRRC